MEWIAVEGSKIKKEGPFSKPFLRSLFGDCSIAQVDAQ
jgi:hypothetical protein